MEKVQVHAHFHAGHRQMGYPGKCEWVHGHTWRAKIIVSTDEFPRDNLDMSLDFGDLKAIARSLDHKMMVSKDDALFLDEEKFCRDGIVIIEGRGPSVENVAKHIFRGVVAHIQLKYPSRGIEYFIEVEIQETENNFFTVSDRVTV